MPASIDRKPMPMQLQSETIIMMVIMYFESESQTTGSRIMSHLSRKALRYPTLSPAKMTCQTFCIMVGPVMDGR